MSRVFIHYCFPVLSRKVKFSLFTFILLGCIVSIPTYAKKLSKLSSWKQATKISRSGGLPISAFAVQFYNEDGQPQELKWIEDPQVVSSFVSAILIDQAQIQKHIMADDTQKAFAKLQDGTIIEFELYNITAGEAGYVILDRALIPTDPKLQNIIAQTYEIPNYDSGEEALKSELVSSEPDELNEEPEDFDPSSLNPTRGLNGGVGQIRKRMHLIVWQDNDGDTESKEQATYLVGYARSKTNDAIMIEATGVKNTAQKINQLAKENDACFQSIIFSVHGSSASIRLGKKFSGQSVSYKRSSPIKFGKAIAPALCPKAKIKLMSCKPAKGAKGKKFLQDLANSSKATVEGSDESITINYGSFPPRVYNERKSAILWVANPGEKSPRILKSPAGDFDDELGKTIFGFPVPASE